MTHTAIESPARRLLGHTLPGGWKVIELLNAGDTPAGGWFSVSYKVEHVDGHLGFLKALDYTKSLKSGMDPLRHMQNVTTAFNFERDILAECASKQMSRVVRAINEGWVDVDPTLPFGVGRVEYLIFEWAAHGDVRAQVNLMEAFDTAWALRCLHCVAVGLGQLHRRGIAHQDMKQSNVLVFDQTISKIGDLGRAVVRGQTGPSDQYKISGDRLYAPPELLYGASPEDWNGHRLGCDLYQLGSLVLFIFTGVSANAHLVSHLNPSLHFNRYKGTFAEILPLLEDAFSKVLLELSGSSALPGRLQKDLTEMTRYLCHPNPAERGHFENRRGHHDRFDLSRFISWFERLARDAERGLIPRSR